MGSLGSSLGPIFRRAMLICRQGLIGLVILTAPQYASADGIIELRLSIEGHKFSPIELEVPAGKKVKLIVENRDATPEEFESYDLNREKIVAGKASIVVFIGPLKAGRYEFFGDFNPQLARGHIVAK
jgi:hypothetical protein